MPNEIYVFHPGVGQKASGTPGPVVSTKSGTNFTFIEQDFGANVTTTAYFHGAVVPPDLAAAGNVVFRITLRQVTAGAGAQVEFDVLYNTIRQPQPPTPYVPAPPDRDVPLSSIGSVNVPVPGTVGEEVSVEFTIPVGSFTSGDELLLGVQRIIGGTDTFVGGTMALVRLDTDFPIQASDSPYINTTPLYQAHGGLPVGWNFPPPGFSMQQMFDYILYPFRTPTIDSFSLSDLVHVPGPVPSVLEVGNSIPQWVPPGAPPAPPNTIRFTWSTTDPDGHITANTVDVDHVGVGNLATGLANDGIEDLVLHPAADPVHITAANMPVGSGTVPVSGPNSKVETFRISIDYTRQMTPPPAPPTTFTLTRDSVHTWYWRVFAGTNVNTSLTEPQIEALSDYNSLTGQVSRTYNFSAGGYKYVCYPDTFAWATLWTDTLTGFNVPFQNVGTVLVTNPYGEAVLYKVQRSSNVIGAAINITVS